jgi:hypothetical protein
MALDEGSKAVAIVSYTTNRIDCDRCDATFYDAVEVSPDIIRKFAVDAGWLNDCGDDFCPACRAKMTRTVVQMDMQTFDLVGVEVQL